MATILTDTSPEGMLQAIQADLRATWASFGAGPGCELLDTVHITKLFTGQPLSISTIVPFFNACEADADATLAETLAYYRAKGIPSAWWLGPWTKPADIDGRLRSLGPSRTSDVPDMAMALEELPEQWPVPEGVAIEEIIDSAALRTYVDLDLRVFGFATTFDASPVERMLRIDEAAGYGPGYQWRHFMAWRDGRPVSNTSLFLGGGAARAIRRRHPARGAAPGIATAVVLRALGTAQQMGYRIPLYECLGFHEYCRINIYEWDLSKPAT